MSNDMTKYNNARPLIQTGDPLAYHGTSPLDIGIQLKSGYWNHISSAIYLEEFQGMQDRIFTEEALTPGLVINLLSRSLSDYSGHVCLYKMLPVFDDQMRNDFAAFILDEQGKDYAVRDMLSQLFERTEIAEIKDGVVTLIPLNAYFCSESWFVAWLNSGLKNKDRNPEAWKLIEAALVKLHGCAPWPDECYRLGLTESIGVKIM